MSDPVDVNLSVRALLDATTTMYRKGAAVERHDEGAVQVTEVWLGVDAQPDEPPTDETTVVDVHFFTVAVDRRAAATWADTFYALCDAWPPDRTYMPEDRLAGGPSYIELGAQVGTLMGQQDALRLMALGEVLGAWKVITPARLFGADVSQREADRAAGQGYVMISGYHGRPTATEHRESAT